VTLKSPATQQAAPDELGLDQSRLTHLVGYAASRASNELKKAFARRMAPLQLKAVEFSILALVASNPGVNQKRIAQALDISAPNMAITLDRLVERGWVERVRSTRDRRAQQIHMTAKGRELEKRAGEIAIAMEDEPLCMLSAAERALLIELLLKVAMGKARLATEVHRSA
jgi:DNA-binding MarR family transcriptional regulator